MFLQAVILKAETPVFIESFLVHSIHAQQILDEKVYEEGAREMEKLVIHLPSVGIRLWPIESIAEDRKMSGALPSLAYMVNFQPMNVPA